MGRRLTGAVAAIAAVAAFAPSPASAALPPVKHVFVILLENENADSTFGPNSKAPFLAQQLPAMGPVSYTHLTLPTTPYV